MGSVLIILLLSSAAAWSVQPPFRRGVNLTDWLQTAGARQIHFTRFTRQDLANIKRLGCDVVRLPINLQAMTGKAPGYALDPLLLFFLDQIIDWAEELDLHLILDNHASSIDADTDPELDRALVPIWRQMARHFMGRSMLLHYELLNEPHGIADARWNEIQQQVVTAIRNLDPDRSIVVGPANWNSFHNLAFMPDYADEQLISTFHFYEPFVFTHQGATWTTPSMASLAGVPFPYRAERMPALPVALAGTWVGSALADYPRQGRVERLEELLDIAAAFQQQRQVPLFCGEFGVYLPNSAEEDRVFWYQVVRQGLEERSIAWTIWDYQGGFGLFERGSNELFEFDLNIPLVRALGLEEPLQREFVLEPEVEGFELYRDFIGPQMVASNWISGGEVDYYSEEEPAQGRYCVHWSGAQRYNYLGFDFRPVKDLSRLVEAGYALELWVRGDRPGASFDVRLMDTNREGEDLPWRMRYTVTDKDGPWDGQWHPLRLPLNHFSEHGAWDGEWFAPRGQFDWTAVDRFEIVAEHRDLEGVGLWFDDIRVAGAQVASAVLEGEGGAAPAAFALHPNYPNPFNASTTIAYALPVDGRVEIAVYNAQGQRVRTLLEAFQPAGLHALVWDGLDQTGQRAASGLYFYRMATADFLAAGKMALVR